VTAAIALVAFLLCWSALALVVAGVHRLVKPLLDGLHPQARSALLLGLAVLPLAVGLLVIVLGFAPLIGGWVVDEHCHPATGCETHVPVVHAGALYVAALVLTAVVTSVAILWSIGRRLQKSLLVARTLRFLAEPQDRQPYDVIDSREPFAYCVGLLRPRVVMSRALIDRLAPSQLEVVVRHEQSHAVRRDNLRLWLAGVALLLAPQRLKQPLLADLSLSNEQVCDQSAALVAGAPRVLETLAALGATTSTSGPRRRAAFDGAETIAGRIRALSSSAQINPPMFIVEVFVAVVCAASAIVVTDLVHHGAELLLASFG
jgi:Zn-dependent protease with chaperone function